MTDQERFTAVDRYYEDLLSPADPALTAALQASAAAQLPQINVSPNQGKLLHILARSCNARRILEIGTLGGYSTIWLARALPADGHLVTLEANPKHADVARANIARAGLTGIVELILDEALVSLPRIAADPGHKPFDFIFIDADKLSTVEYFGWAMKLARVGSLIIIDNVVRKGAIIDASSSDDSVQGIRRFNKVLAADHRVAATAVQTVGSKGYDGFTIAVVTSLT